MDVFNSTTLWGWMKETLKARQRRTKSSHAAMLSCNAVKVSPTSNGGFLRWRVLQKPWKGVMKYYMWKCVTCMSVSSPYL